MAVLRASSSIQDSPSADPSKTAASMALEMAVVAQRLSLLLERSRTQGSVPSASIDPGRPELTHIGLTVPVSSGRRTSVSESIMKRLLDRMHKSTNRMLFLRLVIGLARMSVERIAMRHSAIDSRSWGIGISRVGHSETGEDGRRMASVNA